MQHYMGMALLSSSKIIFGLGRFLLFHPKEIGRLPQWIPQRDSSPLELRVPWWPYDATAWLGAHLPPEARVFEYGGGGSTLWLQDNGARVTVVEHNPIWCQQLKEALPSAAVVLQRDAEPIGKIPSDVHGGFFDRYVAAINEQLDESLDLVIVDGRARVDCVRRAMPKVKPGGLLLLDDTQRSRYQPAIEDLTHWERNVFEGLKPGDLFPAQTSIWRRPA